MGRDEGSRDFKSRFVLIDFDRAGNMSSGRCEEARCSDQANRRILSEIK